MFLLLPAYSASAKEPPADPRLLLRPLPGLQADGAVLLPNQWSLRPTGKQVEVGNFPVNVALHPQGDWAAVLHSGYGPHEVVVVDLKTASVVSRVTLPKTFYGLCFTPNGERLLVSGGEDDVVYQFHFADGQLSDREVIELAQARDGPGNHRPGVQPRRPMALCGLLPGQSAGGFAVAASGEAAVDRHAGRKPPLYRAACGEDQSAVRQPVGEIVGGGGRSATSREKIEATWPTASHPTEMVLSPDEDLLYVACADSNTVSVIDTRTGRQIEVITTSLYPQAPHGSTPNSLALAPNGKTLWVANADANNLAVIDVSRRGQSRSLGFIPVGWYPTSVRMSAACGPDPRGQRQGPELEGQSPWSESAA